MLEERISKLENEFKTLKYKAIIFPAVISFIVSLMLWNILV